MVKWTTLFWLACVIAVAALVVAVVANDWWDDLTTAFEAALVYLRGHALLVIVAAIGLAIVSYLLCRWAARSFRLIVLSPDSKAWLEQPVAHPAGVTASWSGAYGLLFLVAAVVQDLAAAGPDQRRRTRTTRRSPHHRPLRRRTALPGASCSRGEEWTKNAA